MVSLLERPEANLEKAAEYHRLILEPPPDLTVTQWADGRRYLSREYSKPPGLYLIGDAPYQREPQDSVKDPEVQSTVLMWAAQTGKSVIIENIEFYFVDAEPSPILLVVPTEKFAKTYSRERLAPTIRDTAALRDKIADPKSRDGSNTILNKTFPGGSLSIEGANSPTGLAGRSRRIVLLDEVDRFPGTAGSEGDPCLLAIKRTENFHDAIVIHTSTPTVKDASRIESEFKQSDQRYYYVPCPKCHTYQTLQWNQVAWDRDRHGKDLPKTARYICIQCEAQLTDEDRRAMVLEGNGEWRPTAPFEGKRGYHLNGLYSPFTPRKGFKNRLHKAVADYLEAKAIGEGTEEEFGERTWTNTFKAETYEVKGEELEEETIRNKAEAFPFEIDETGDRRDLLPEKVLLMTAGIDTQDDRLAVKLEGWGLAQESWVTRWLTLMGDPARDEVWNALDDVLATSWKRHRDDRELYIARACIDVLGHKTDYVFEYVRQCHAGRRPFRHIHAVQGSPQPGGQIIKTRIKQKRRRKVELVTLATDTAKDTIFNRLRLTAPGPGYIHHPDTLEEEYYLQLTAEKAIPRENYRTYVKTRDRNEALDCSVYSLAALRLHRENINRYLEYLERRRLAGLAAMQDKPEARPEARRPTMKKAQRRNWAKQW